MLNRYLIFGLYFNYEPSLDTGWDSFQFSVENLTEFLNSSLYQKVVHFDEIQIVDILTFTVILQTDTSHLKRKLEKLCEKLP